MDDDRSQALVEVKIMNPTFVTYQPPEPRDSIDLATVSLVTASQLLGDALKTVIDPEERGELLDIMDQVDGALDRLRDLDI